MFYHAYMPDLRNLVLEADNYRLRNAKLYKIIWILNWILCETIDNEIVKYEIK